MYITLLSLSYGGDDDDARYNREIFENNDNSKEHTLTIRKMNDVYFIVPPFYHYNKFLNKNSIACQLE